MKTAREILVEQLREVGMRINDVAARAAMLTEELQRLNEVNNGLHAALDALDAEEGKQ